MDGETYLVNILALNFESSITGIKGDAFIWLVFIQECQGFIIIDT